MNRYFDLQVNGYAGVDFNSDDLSAEALHAACARLQSEGVAGILATIITEKLPTMSARLQRLVELREADETVRQTIAGFHIEGPFISPLAGFRGAHPVDAIGPADEDAMKDLLDAAAGLTRLVTLAPEMDADSRVTRLLNSRNITVAAGHCDASLDQLRAACDAGLSLFTHLGNGCPMMQPRHDNIVQRALSLSDRLRFCFIADGAHVPFFALKNYLKCAGIERCIIVTDAVSPAGLGPGRYSFARWTLDIGADLVARAPDGSHLVGAVITMPQSAANLRDQLELSPAQIEQLTLKNPRLALGII